MNKASLFRLEKGSQGIMGAFVLNGEFLGDTLEHPLLCIPTGEYICKFMYSPTFDRNLYELIDVPERTEVKFHVGNTMDDTKGCILLGKYIGYCNNKRAVLASGDTIDTFHALMNCEDLQLSIYNFIGLMEGK